MKLTGKCKEDFLKEYNKSEIHFNGHSLNYKYKLIIEFFRSKGVNITFKKSKLGGCLLYFSNEFEGIGVGWNLQDIKEKSICVANKNYNDRL
jgi:hypothetical protein